ncbi:MAG: glycosyltransferase family 4 protein [Intrasporangium sp.]|uniref:glycosyltransferase family 4 protein n=1 Tax=Intrasporangium sp. TaxID=1925024 RepID=UPI003F7F5BD8
MPTPLVIAAVARERGITGVHTHVRQLRGYLDRTGQRAELITPHTWVGRGFGAWWREAVLLPLFGVRVLLERTWGPAHVWWYRTSHEIFLRRVLRHRLASLGPCTVYAQCPVAARAALAARSGPQQRVVLAVHFGTSQADEWVHKDQISRDGRVFRWIRRTERQVVPRVDGLVFVSGWARAALRAWLPEADGVPSTVLTNFVKAAPVAADPPPSADLVSVGNLAVAKNHRYLLQVLAEARAAGHEYSLDIFGMGEERENLRRLAAELGLSQQVRLQGFRSDVEGLLPAYKAYVHASYVETSSLAIMEAMAAGLPIISSTAGALAELFNDPAEGRFWPLDDPVCAARILTELLEDPEELDRAGQAARRRFHRNYDAEVVAPRLLRFLSAPTHET